MLGVESEGAGIAGPFFMFGACSLFLWAVS